MSRIPIAETGLLPPYKTSRVAWFYFVYDWETREKRVVENDALFADPGLLPKEYPANTHLYRIQVCLPPPVQERTETELAIVPEVEHLTEDNDTRAPLAGDPAYWIARGLFFQAGEVLPKDTFVAERVGTGYGVSFGLPENRFAPQFTMETGFGKFRVTVEKL